jgi:hypothetical protein
MAAPAARERHHSGAASVRNHAEYRCLQRSGFEPGGESEWDTSRNNNPERNVKTHCFEKLNLLKKHF